MLGDLDKEEFRNNLFDYIRSLGFMGTISRFKIARRVMFGRLTKTRLQNREIRIEDLYQGLFFDLGLHPDKAALDYIHDLYIQSFNVELVDGVIEVLENLTERYRLAIVSNSMSNVARYAIKRFQLEKYFTTIVISRDLGIRKPDPEIFQFTLQNLDIESDEAAHVGDSLEEDVQGAKNAGIKAIWIKSCGDGTTRSDYTIKSFTELISLFPL